MESLTKKNSFRAFNMISIQQRNGITSFYTLLIRKYFWELNLEFKWVCEYQEEGVSYQFFFWCDTPYSGGAINSQTNLNPKFSSDTFLFFFIFFYKVVEPVEWGSVMRAYTSSLINLKNVSEKNPD